MASYWDSCWFLLFVHAIHATVVETTTSALWRHLAKTYGCDSLPSTRKTNIRHAILSFNLKVMNNKKIILKVTDNKNGEWTDLLFHSYTCYRICHVQSDPLAAPGTQTVLWTHTCMQMDCTTDMQAHVLSHTYSLVLTPNISLDFIGFASWLWYQKEGPGRAYLMPMFCVSDSVSCPEYYSIAAIYSCDSLPV